MRALLLGQGPAKVAASINVCRLNYAALSFQASLHYQVYSIGINLLCRYIRSFMLCTFSRNNFEVSDQYELHTKKISREIVVVFIKNLLATS